MHSIFGGPKAPSPSASVSSENPLSTEFFSMSSNDLPDIPKSSSPQRLERSDADVMMNSTEAGAEDGDLYREELWRNVLVKANKDVPKPVTLETASLSPCFLENLRNWFSELLPLQERTIPILLEKEHNLLVKSPVGSGKTLAFGIAAIQMALSMRDARFSRRNNGAVVIILADTDIHARHITIRLKEITDEIEIYGLYNGGDSLDHLDRYSDVYILVATMETLIDAMDEIETQNLRLLVLDGADSIMARSSFEQEISDFLELLDPGVRKRMRVAVFTAFYEKEEQGLVDWENGVLAELFKYGHPVEIIVKPTVGYVEQRFVLIKNQLSLVNKDDLIAMPQKEAFLEVFRTTVHMQKIGWLRGLLEHDKELYYKNGRYTKTAAVFVESITTCNFLSTYLLSMGYDVLPLISEDDVDSVRQTLKKLSLEGSIQAVITTNKIARRQGIPDLHHMIFYDMPSNFNLYKHRIGQTGLIGRGGISTAFFHTKKDIKHVEDLEQFLIENEQDVPRWLRYAADNARQWKQANQDEVCSSSASSSL